MQVYLAWLDEVVSLESLSYGDAVRLESPSYGA